MELTKEQQANVTRKIAKMFPPVEVEHLAQRAAIAMAIEHALGDPDYKLKYGTFCTEGLQAFINSKE